MASDLQIAANRRNALKSTGPRRTSGKMRAAGNSKKHGLASNPNCDAMALAAANRLADAIFQSHGGLSRAVAHRLAMATVELKGVQKVRAAAMEAVMSGEKNSMLGDIADLLRKLKAIDRYEIRAAAKKRRILRSTT